MSKQTPTQSRQNNITRWHVKTNTHTIKTKQYYKITSKLPHNQDRTIIQEHMSKQTPMTIKTKQYYKNKHVKTNTNAMKTKQYYKMTWQNKHPHNRDKTILQEHMSKQTPTQWRQHNITRSHVKTNTHTIKTKQYYKMTWQNKHPHNQDKTILQDHVKTSTQSR